MTNLSTALGEDVSATPIRDTANSPLLIRPGIEASKQMLWIKAHKPAIEQELRQRGALIFRGFGIDSPERLLEFAGATSNDSPNFKEESSPRSQVSGAVYTSTDYPEDYEIQFHNEYSYANEWPMKLYFACIIPSQTAGETPVASTRGLLSRLSPETVKAFRAKGIMYVRNFSSGMGVSWQTAFQTSDKAVVEAYCRSRGLGCEWIEGDVLRTRKVQNPIVKHPITGEDVWFNHGFFWNARALEPMEVREYFLSLEPDSLPTNTFYGDGSLIPEDVVDEIRAAYAAEAIRVPWEKGDVLLIDNMLMSHGRSSFSGPRRIVVQMADGFKRSDLA
ncbi:MAG: TauD/TfdA family dioxygenase [Proteobacteria bacterium]|nr:MAG: TauD/TfdA family dioxygenase [Pseudomonadota bacterium]